MNQLVVMKNQKAVTTSLQVAQDFEKQHKHVLEAIDEIVGVAENPADLFYESTYTHPQNKQEYRMFFMNRDGFSLLAMGFTGKKAMAFKFRYIDAFNQMEKSLNAPKPLTEKEQLKASMRLSLETSEELEEVKNEVAEVKSMVENQITLDHGEQRGLQKAIARRVYEIENDPEYRPKLFGEIHREIKDRFGVTSYKDVKRKDLLSAIRYVNAWIPRRAA